MKKGLVAVSGGVDSTAVMLGYIKNGVAVDGVMMKIHDADKTAVADADAACKKLGARLHILDLEDEFKKLVIDDFVYEYLNCRTPNPCILCNIRMKFGILADFAKESGYDFLATGHYARIEQTDGKFFLKKAADLKKDQSYVLFGINRELLPYLRFPMGDTTKESAREELEKEGFINAKRKDSQDICFVPDGKYAEFIERYLGRSFEEGDFCDLDGNVIGRHKGLIRYTIGQRKGLGLALPQPMYVVELKPETNSVVLGLTENLMSNRLTADRVNWLADGITDGIRVMARARYNMKESPARVFFAEDNRIVVEFDEPQRAITSGQSVVLYDGDIVLGGGRII
ncbi:MAG: tRNA 2-thiouridine(34) synthase MnmA [Clostridia bacterium]|nr:tRNA 2-thiouridine(34) synthase MnmA [Clostridia bacterium]